MWVQSASEQDTREFDMVSQKNAKILICDDDPDIVRALSIYLKDEGFEIYTAFTGREALNALDEVDMDLALLDIMMPELDGIMAAQKIRERYNLPIIFISAKSEDKDKITGLIAGADDYITKPFNPAEVIARVRSQLRRYTMLGGRVASDTVYETGGLAIDTNKKVCTVNDEEVNLTNVEYRILLFLLKNKGQVYRTDEIYENVWQQNALGADSVVSVHIHHIREKIEANPQNPQYIKVLWGKGYKVEDMNVIETK